jgi:ABC-type transporter Mla subunit MlaD
MKLRISRPVSHSASNATIIIATLVALAVLCGLSYLAWVAPRGVPGLSYYDLHAQFDNAAQIADLSQVRIAGRNVGQVTDTRYRAGHAIIDIALYPGQAPLHADSKFRLRLQGLLGGKYVEIDPSQRGPMMPNGSTIPVSQTSTAVDVISFLQTVNTPAQRNLTVSVRGLGEGFLGRGAGLAQMLTVAPGFFGDLRDAAAAVNARTGAAARLAPSAELLAGAYDPVRNDLAAGFEPSARVLQAFVDKQQQVRQLLDVAPSSLTALNGGLVAGTPLLHEVAGLARAANALTKPAPAALKQTATLLREAGPALNVTGPDLRTLARAVPSTLGFLDRVDPIITPSISTLKESVVSLLALGRHSCDVLSFAANWHSALAFGVATGSGALAAGEPGLGPLNSLRVLPVRLLSELNSDAPAANPPARDPYPAPCAAPSEGQP